MGLSNSLGHKIVFIFLSQLVTLHQHATSAAVETGSTLPGQEMVPQAEQTELKLVAMADVTEYLVGQIVTIKVRLRLVALG